MEGNKPPPYHNVPPPAVATAYPPQTTYPPPPPPPAASYPPPPAAVASYPPQQQPAPGYLQPPVQPGYAPPQTTTVIVGQPTVAVQIPTSYNLRDRPVNVVCPNCHNNIVTSCDYVSGNMTWLAVIILCLLFWPCAWLPFVYDGCKDVSHRCPACHFVIGFFRRI